MSLQKHIYHNVIEAQFGNTHLLNNVKNFRIRKPFFIVFDILISIEKFLKGINSLYFTRLHKNMCNENNLKVKHLRRCKKIFSVVI